MISLIIPPKDQISRVAKMLADEYGTASNIKSRVNRLSVLGAITSVQQRLKLYNKGKERILTNKNGIRITLFAPSNSKTILTVKPCMCSLDIFLLKAVKIIYYA